MEEAINKGTDAIPKEPTNGVNSNALLQIAQAINNMNNRVSKLEINAMKGDANQEIFDKKLDLLHKTIELMEKQMEKGD